jgi:hypothetical protein
LQTEIETLESRFKARKHFSFFELQFSNFYTKKPSSAEENTKSTFELKRQNGDFFGT